MLWSVRYRLLCWSLRLLVEARSGDEESQREITRAVRDRLGKDAAGRAWKVKRMFATPGRTTDEELGTFFEVTGSVSASPSYPLQKVGFDIARGLSEAKMIRHAQPDLPSSLYGAVTAVPVVAMHGRGFGEALVGFVEDDAAASGRAEMQLEVFESEPVHPHLSRIRAWFERRGYNETSRLPLDALYPGDAARLVVAAFDVVTMRKWL